jgi:hypothetical protein
MMYQAANQINNRYEYDAVGECANSSKENENQ